MIDIFSLVARKLFLPLCIAVCIWCLWLWLLGVGNVFYNLKEHSEIAWTMALGSFVAGSTSLGGGAVAFPVLTKLLQVETYTALKFSLAIQSVGMTSASLVFLIKRVPLCYRVILASCVLGGLGMVTGLFGLRLVVQGSEAKYLFTCFTLLVAVFLFWDYHSDRSPLKKKMLIPIWVLLPVSFLGGLLSGVIGVGADFLLFSIMILYGYDFKQATATSVVVMAANALVGFLSLLLFTSDFSGLVVEYWLAAVPVVVLGAPLGAMLCKYAPRWVLFYFLMSLIVLEVVSTFAILGLRMDFILPTFLLVGAAFVLRRLLLLRA